MGVTQRGLSGETQAEMDYDPPKKNHHTPPTKLKVRLLGEGGVVLSFWPNTVLEGGAIRGRKDAAPATAAAPKKENQKLAVCHFHFCKARLFKKTPPTPPLT